MSLKLIAAVCTTAIAAAVALEPVSAQAPQLPEQTADVRRGAGDTSLFAPLTFFPSPNVYRSASGAPGPKYWQNRANYDLRATLDTATNTLTGSMTLRYTNNSPDTLTFIWFQTEQNAFRPNSLNSMVFAQNSRFGARNFKGGDVFDHFNQVIGGKQVSVKLRDNETVTKVDLARPLAPGQTATFDVAWHFAIPEHGADRMGRDGSLYEIAQWYPRVNVYDDVRGWNLEPYLGQGEFYLEYGDFNLSVTVPAGYIVAATGTLSNAHDVLTSAQIGRLAKAAKSDKPVVIISAEELASGAARPKKSGTLTWKFSAKNVRDVAWGAAPNYQWEASSWHGVLAQAYFRPSAVGTWGNGDAADMARMSIQEYSERWFQYPYPQISVVEGPVSGMEYPMLAMEDRNPDKFELYNVITHEIGHNWFPMIVGSNERAEFWQDEGFNTFVNTFSEARRYPENGDQMQRAAHERGQIEQTQQYNVDLPITTTADRIPPQKLGFTAYYKTSVGLQFLRQEIIGPDAFDDAFRTYIKRWAFKHPTPADFYRTMENVGGRRLDWFWREWFLESPHFDQTIDTVVMQGAQVAVRYANKARGVMPIRARFTFTDGTTQDFVYPAEVWSTDTHFYVRQYDFQGKQLKRIDLDPDHRLIDVDRNNNTWIAPDSK
jgi:hypothetical protein